MARPASITNEQVIKAGIELESQDKPINPTSLRATIGGGNPARLFAIWNEYRGLNPAAETPAEQDQEDPESSLPDTVLREIERVTDRVKHLLIQTSESAHGQVEAVAAAEIEEVKAELVKAQNEQADWKYSAVKLAKELQEMTLSAKDLTEKKHELSFSLGAAEKLAADRDLEITEARAEIEKLKKENADLSEQNAVLEQRIESITTESVKTENRLTAEVVQLSKDVKKLAAEKSKLAEKNAVLVQQMEERKFVARSTEASLHRTIIDREAALDVAKKENAELGAKNAELGAKNARVEGELTGLKESMAISAKTISNLEAQLADLKKPKVTFKKKRFANEEKTAAQKK